ncbi:hypothetical protein PoMZ_11427 [Pyricularia oryzae]|uniref:Uncharacterized protein n=1 Tax=Pyricularia oryzae TaxID=318829 RepID=A0A4P7NKB8_PYROR|nr:hypothetical protein PoMZ_11427 [Pyricularia oryzae]
MICPGHDNRAPEADAQPSDSVTHIPDPIEYTLEQRLGSCGGGSLIGRLLGSSASRACPFPHSFEALLERDESSLTLTLFPHRFSLFHSSERLLGPESDMDDIHAGLPAAA